jgi:hypothetical protein
MVLSKTLGTSTGELSEGEFSGRKPEFACGFVGGFVGRLVGEFICELSGRFGGGFGAGSELIGAIGVDGNVGDAASGVGFA